MKTDEKATEISAADFAGQYSPTAATVGNALFGPSGVITYRVSLHNGIGVSVIDVDAATGDDAASAALAQSPGCKVTHVDVAPRKAA